MFPLTIYGLKGTFDLSSRQTAHDEPLLILEELHTSRIPGAMSSANRPSLWLNIILELVDSSRVRMICSNPFVAT